MCGQPTYTTHMQHCHTQIPYFQAFQAIKTLIRYTIQNISEKYFTLQDFGSGVFF